MHILWGPTQTSHLVYFLFISFIDVKVSEIITFKFLFFDSFICWPHPHIFHTFPFLLLFPFHNICGKTFLLPIFSHHVAQKMHATNRPFSILLLSMWSINANMCGSNQRNQNWNSCQPPLLHCKSMHHHCIDVKKWLKKKMVTSALVSCSDNVTPEKKCTL